MKNRHGWGFLLVLGIISCQMIPGAQQEKKITGISFVGPRTEVDEDKLRHLDEVNAAWVALMPFAYCPAGADTLEYDYERQWWGEGKDGVRKCIKMCKKRGQKVMIKPQIWIAHGSFTGDLYIADQTKFLKWFGLYADYILQYASMAEEENVELFCIGTELKSIIENHSTEWLELIKQVKAVYSGKLTYAANWDNYLNIPFWDELDYIGVDAYFPLEVKKELSLAKLNDAWKEHKKALEQHSNRHNIPILFTEAGYRSIENPVARPWDDSMQAEINLLHQDLAYRALFDSFWEEPFFAGMFIWKWFDDHEALEGRRYLIGFTPQKKPAQATISQYYK